MGVTSQPSFNHVVQSCCCPPLRRKLRCGTFQGSGRKVAPGMPSFSPLLLRIWVLPSPTVTPPPPTCWSSLLEALLLELPQLPLPLLPPLWLLRLQLLSLLLPQLLPMPLASPTTPLTQATLEPSTPATLPTELTPLPLPLLMLLPLLLPMPPTPRLLPPMPPITKLKL